MTSKSPRKPPGKEDPRTESADQSYGPGEELRGPPFDSRDQERSRKKTSGYAEEQLHPKRKGRKLPGEGGPHEPHNNPKQNPAGGMGSATRAEA